MLSAVGNLDQMCSQMEKKTMIHRVRTKDAFLHKNDKEMCIRYVLEFYQNSEPTPKDPNGTEYEWFKNQIWTDITSAFFLSFIWLRKFFSVPYSLFC